MSRRVRERQSTPDPLIGLALAERDLAWRDALTGPHIAHAAADAGARALLAELLSARALRHPRQAVPTAMTAALEAAAVHAREAVLEVWRSYGDRA